MAERNPKDEKKYRIIIIVFAAILTAFLYLALCNGRYMEIDGRIFDKWTRTLTDWYDFMKE